MTAARRWPQIVERVKYALCVIVLVAMYVLALVVTQLDGPTDGWF